MRWRPSMRPGSPTAALDVRAPLRALAAATAFLTRLPVPARWVDAGEIGSGAPAFPLIGAAIGALVGETAALIARVEPALVAGGVAVGLELLLTGACTSM